MLLPTTHSRSGIQTFEIKRKHSGHLISSDIQWIISTVWIPHILDISGPDIRTEQDYC